eukprot:2513168-Pyramimonas_sp.AAC.1
MASWDFAMLASRPPGLVAAWHRWSRACELRKLTTQGATAGPLLQGPVFEDRAGAMRADGRQARMRRRTRAFKVNNSSQAAQNDALCNAFTVTLPYRGQTVW